MAQKRIWYCLRWVEKERYLFATVNKKVAIQEMTQMNARMRSQGRKDRVYILKH